MRFSQSFETNLILLALAVAAGACSPPAPSDLEVLETAVVGTVQALSSLPPSTPTPTPSPTPTLTRTHTPTPTATFTPLPPRVHVSVATNCRKGPSEAYSFVVSIESGHLTEVTALSTFDNYYYIANPEQPDQSCWLSGEHASLHGDASELPVLTPPAIPTPKIGFNLYHYGFRKCGATHVVFSVVNNGGTTFQTGRIHVKDLTSNDDLHGPALDRHPFAPSPSACPPGHGNIFPPGAGAYIVVPVSSAPKGHDGMATIKLCTEDYLGGSCVSQSAYFRFPN